MSFKERTQKEIKQKKNETDEAFEARQQQTPTIEKIHKVKFGSIVGDVVRRYSNELNDPDCNDHDEFFNHWSGFRSAPVEQFNIDKIQPMLDFIYEVIAGGNTESYEYVLDWLACCLKYPGKPVGIFLFLVSQAKGTGKNTFCEFVANWLFGQHTSANTSGLDKILGRFNGWLLGKKLCVVNELSSLSENMRSDFNKFKDMATNEELQYEDKFKKPFTSKNFLGYILNSNHEDAVYIENGCRRWACLRVSPVHSQDKKYFAKLRKQCFNLECANHFHTFLLNRNVDYPLPPIETELRKEIINLSMSASEKFVVDYLSRRRDEIEKVDENELTPVAEIKASELFEEFCRWCDENNERKTTSTKFGRALNSKLLKKRKNGNCVYYLIDETIDLLDDNPKANIQVENEKIIIKYDDDGAL
jgi:hypothetical protein